MKTILFVCTGNTCRSSMAESLFRDLLEKEEHNLGDIQVISAGTFAGEGEEASSGAKEALKEKGLSLGEHRSKPLTRELVEEADLILTMTNSHKKNVLYLNPEARDKVYTLKEYVNDGETSDVVFDNMDIMDPFGQSLDIYRQSAMEIEESLKKLLKKLTKK